METRWKLLGGGTLICRDEGTGVRLSASREDDQKGLYKVWLLGGNGGRCLMGTMVPEKGQLKLSKTLSHQWLAQSNCWPVQGGEAVLAFHFTSNKPQPSWRRGVNWDRRIGDRVLLGCIGSTRDILFQEYGNGFRLAAPFEPNRPMPLIPIFCLGQVVQLEGRWHIIWQFNPDGQPILPYKK